MATIKRRRKRFNRFAKVLSEIYGREYNDVLKLYNHLGNSVSDTKAILNLTST